MKVYISADMEGVAGITHWEETDPSNTKDYRHAQELMTEEVSAACQGAMDAGATEIWVKDAHWNGRNIMSEKLPREARLIRGWSGHPYMMMQELDSSFQAAALIGYHSEAGSSGNPMSHTMSGRSFARILMNDQPISEFHLNTLTAMREGVPVVFLSGDQALCQKAGKFNERIETVATMQGIGASTLNLNPLISREQIRSGMKRALLSVREFPEMDLPELFKLEVHYKSHAAAYRMSFFPGAKLKSDEVVQYESRDYLDVLRFILFAPALS